MKYFRTVLAAAAVAFAASTPVFAKANVDPNEPHVQLVQFQNDQSAIQSRLPIVSGVPVFELDHDTRKVYTVSAEEKRDLLEQGWKYQGPVFYSSETEGSMPVYRLHDATLNIVYSLSDSIPGYVLDGPAFYVQKDETAWQTINLESDRDSTIVVHNGQNVIVNLNGHNVLPKYGPAIMVARGGTIIVNGDGNLHAYGSEPAIRNNGSAVLNGGRFENNGNYCVINHGSMIINGGEYTHTDRDCVSSLINTGYQNYYSGNAANGYVAGQNASSPMLTINGGDFHGGRWLLKSDDNGRVYVTGGNFHDAKYSVIKNWATLELLGGTFTARENGEPYGLITNGHVVSDGLNIDPGTLDIYGGTFHPGAYIFYPANNSDGAQLVYGDITIYNMDVTGNAPLTNTQWPVANDYAYNEIIGAENINRDI